MRRVTAWMVIDPASPLPIDCAVIWDPKSRIRMPDATMIFMSPLLPRPVAVLAIWAPPAIVRLPAATDTDPPAPEPRLPAFIVLVLDDPAESSRMSPLAVTLMVPPFPQPASVVQPAPEAMKDPARRLTVCADTVTEPALPEPELTALMLLGTEPSSPVESRVSLPPALTMTLPPLPQPEPAVQPEFDEMTEPPSKLMFWPRTETEPATPGPWVPALIVLTREDPVESSTMSPLAVTSTAPPLPQPASALQPEPEATKDPASRLTVCADTVTEPALPEPELTALMLLGTDPSSPVESRMSLPLTPTMTLPPLPQPELVVQPEFDEMTEPASKLIFCPRTETEPAAPGPWVPALIVLSSEDPVESSTMSPLARMLTAPPLPQPASALQPEPEAMKEPASRLTVCADTVTEPALPEPELTALMLLGTGPFSPVESRMSLPLALTMTLPPLPHPELVVQLALDEMTAPANRLMSCADTVTEPASPEPM